MGLSATQRHYEVCGIDYKRTLEYYILKQLLTVI